MARFRSRTSSYGGTGLAKALAGGLFDTVTPAGYIYDECTDVIGNRGGQNPLFLSHSIGTVWWASGLIPGWWDTHNIALTIPVDSYPSYANSGIPPMSAKPTNNSAYSEGLAKTNPNTPLVDLPVFVWELADIPRMVLEWGRVLSKKPIVSGGRNLKELPRSAASRYLEYQFAILPFLKDLKGLLDFQASVQSRLTQLDRLGSPGGSVRSGTVYQDENFNPAVAGPTYVSGLYQENRRITYQDKVNRKMWVSTNWTPLIPIPQTVEDRRWLATRLAFGLEVSFSTLWEGMPWSWLIDWFSNVGDLLNLTRGVLPCKFSDSCLMDHTRLSRVLKSTLPGAGSLQIRMPPFLYDQKVRTPMGSGLPQVEFGLPVLTGRQTAILGALAVLKGTARF